MRRFRAYLPFGAIVSLSLVQSSYSQQDSTQDIQSKAPHVFLDCGYQCDQDFIRTEITFVNYVRDPHQADVHVLVTAQQTGSGGQEYTFTFMGKGPFSEVQNTLTYTSRKADTQEDIRKGMVRVLRAGLVAYVARSPLFDQISITHNKKQESGQGLPEDKWDFWVFTIGANSFFNGEKTSSFLNGWSNITASRTTEEWKIRLNTNLNYSEEKFEFAIDDSTTFVTRNFRRSQYLDGSAIYSLGDHWSAGLFLSAYKNTYSNVDLSATAAPSLEYNFFPYSESTRRQLRASYRIGGNVNRYVDTTVYFKKEETLYSHSLSTTLDLRQPWGSSSITIEFSQYLHDFSKNNLQIFSNLSVRVFEGFSLNIYGGYQAIHDQLSLRKSGATVTDILRQQRQLETSFSYWGSVGISYTFGSIYNSIVNPRFGNRGGSTITISN
jgi:hypothetical protein